jgi:hypothetical protein
MAKVREFIRTFWAEARSRDVDKLSRAFVNAFILE